MGAELGSLPGLGALSPLGGTAFGTTAHTAGHGVVHDTFMTLPAYTRIREGEVHELGLGVRSCFHSARSDPWSATRERMERECSALSAEGTARCAFLGEHHYDTAETKEGRQRDESDPSTWPWRSKSTGL